MQREREKKNLRRAKIIAFIIVWSIILGLPLVLGFISGRLTAPEKEITYNPDPCGLEVVVCPGEAEYTAQ